MIGDLTSEQFIQLPNDVTRATRIIKSLVGDAKVERRSSDGALVAQAADGVFSFNAPPMVSEAIMAGLDAPVIPKEINIPEATINQQGLPDENLQELTPSGNPAEAQLRTLQDEPSGNAIQMNTDNIQAPTLPANFEVRVPLESPMINIDGIAPTPSKGLEDIFSRSVQAGDTEGAVKALDAILKSSDVAQRFRKDLSPEATSADLLRGFSERRAGRQPSMNLSKSNAFRGERGNPRDVERQGERDVLTTLSAIGQSKRGNKGLDLQNQQIRTNVQRAIITAEAQIAQAEAAVNMAEQRAGFARAKVALDAAGVELDQFLKLLKSTPNMSPSQREDVKAKMDPILERLEKRNAQIVKNLGR